MAGGSLVSVPSSKSPVIDDERDPGGQAPHRERQASLLRLTKSSGVPLFTAGANGPTPFWTVPALRAESQRDAISRRPGNRSPRQFGGSALTPIPERVNQPRAIEGIKLLVANLPDGAKGCPELLEVVLAAVTFQQV